MTSSDVWRVSPLRAAANTEQQSITGSATVGSSALSPRAGAAAMARLPAPSARVGVDQPLGLGLSAADLVSGSPAGSSCGEHFASLVEPLRSSADRDGSVTVIVEDAMTDNVTVYRKRLLVVDVSSSDEDGQAEEEEDEGWIVSPSHHQLLPSTAAGTATDADGGKAPHTPEPQSEPQWQAAVVPISRWSSMLSWSGGGRGMPPRAAWHHVGAAAV
jgi:hypothetical protein